MNALLSAGDEAQITLTDLSVLTAKEIRNLIAWNGTIKMQPKVVKFIEDHELTVGTWKAVDYAVMEQAARDAETGKVVVMGMAEQIVWPKGCTIDYLPKAITITDVASEKVVYDAGCYPVVKARPALFNILAVVIAMFHLKKGELTCVFKMEAAKKFFGSPDSIMDFNNHRLLRDAVREVMVTDSSYRSAVASASTVVGFAWCNMASRALNNCSARQYLSLHTTFCVFSLKTLVVKKNAQKHQAGRGRFHVVGVHTVRDEEGHEHQLVPDTCISTLPPDAGPKWVKAATKIKKDMGFPPIILTGGLPTHHVWFTSPTPTIKTAVTAKRAREDVCNGIRTGIGALMRSEGFTSVASTMTNRLALLLALVSNAVELGHKKIDVQLTVGDILVFEHSLSVLLNKSHREIVKFVLDYGSHKNVDSLFTPFLIASPRHDAHFISWRDDPLPGVDAKVDPTAKFDEQAKLKIASFGTNSYSVMTPIISPLHWACTEGDNPQPIARVFKFRSPWDFQGIISTLPTISIWNGPNAPIKLDIVPQWGDWLKAVISGNSDYMTYFLKPVPFFSYLSNIVKPPTRGVQMAWSDTHSGFIGDVRVDLTAFYSSGYHAKAGVFLANKGLEDTKKLGLGVKAVGSVPGLGLASGFGPTDDDLPDPDIPSPPADPGTPAPAAPASGGGSKEKPKKKKKIIKPNSSSDDEPGGDGGGGAGEGPMPVDTDTYDGELLG